MIVFSSSYFQEFISNKTAMDGFSGGALTLLGLEAIRKKPLSRETEDLIQYAGYAFLVLAAIWLVTRDLENLALFLSGQVKR